VTVVRGDVAVVAVLCGVGVEVSLGLTGHLHWVLSGHDDVYEIVCVFLKGVYRGQKLCVSAKDVLSKVRKCYVRGTRAVPPRRHFEGGEV